MLASHQVVPAQWTSSVKFQQLFTAFSMKLMPAWPLLQGAPVLELVQANCAVFLLCLVFLLLFLFLR